MQITYMIMESTACKVHKKVRYSAENNKKRTKSRILLKIAGLGENREICCIRGIAISWRDRLGGGATVVQS